MLGFGGLNMQNGHFRKSAPGVGGGTILVVLEGWWGLLGRSLVVLGGSWRLLGPSWVATWSSCMALSSSWVAGVGFQGDPSDHGWPGSGGHVGPGKRAYLPPSDLAGFDPPPSRAV